MLPESLDANLMIMLQNTLQNLVPDTLMVALRDKTTWWPLYVFWSLILVYQFRFNGIKILLLVILAAAVSDLLNSHILKNIFERIRPCRNEEMLPHIRVLIPCSQHYSFPSSHAANHFAVAFTFIFGQVWKKWWVQLLLLTWAGIIGVAQVFVGVHYPGDIAAGSIVGAAIGYLFGKMILKWKP